MDLGLEGKLALVTGSHRGTGSVIAKALAREGALVAVHGPAAGSQRATLDAIAAIGGDAFALSGDITTDEGAAQVAAELATRGRGVDILINNQGGPSATRWFDEETGPWLDAYETNAVSMVRMIRHCVPGMRERGWGRVIQLATIGTWRPNARMPDYYAAKAAVASISASLARELAGSGVTVNTVSPGLIHTPEVEAYLRSRAERKGWGQEWEQIEARGVEEMMPNPCGRMARPEEVADLVVFLASERAGYLNATNLRIDGGATGLSS